jgi:hypothetical protein
MYRVSGRREDTYMLEERIRVGHYGGKGVDVRACVCLVS